MYTDANEFQNLEDHINGIINSSNTYNYGVIIDVICQLGFFGQEQWAFCYHWQPQACK